MWVIQQDALVSLPDDVPVPTGSTRIDVPPDFGEQPEAYKLDGLRLVRRSEEEIRNAQSRMEQLTLTQDHIARIKRAIAEGRL